jgi:hypothetical protein
MQQVPTVVMASTSGVCTCRTTFSGEDVEYLVDNSDSDIDVGNVASENEHVYEDENDSSSEEMEEDSSATGDHVTGTQQGSDWINYLTTPADF